MEETKLHQLGYGCLALAVFLAVLIAIASAFRHRAKKRALGKARQQGVQARQDGKPFAANPYPNGQTSDAWTLGWTVTQPARSPSALDVLRAVDNLSPMLVRLREQWAFVENQLDFLKHHLGQGGLFLGYTEREEPTHQLIEHYEAAIALTTQLIEQLAVAEQGKAGGIDPQRSSRSRPPS